MVIDAIDLFCGVSAGTFCFRDNSGDSLARLNLILVALENVPFFAETGWYDVMPERRFML